MNGRKRIFENLCSFLQYAYSRTLTRVDQSVGSWAGQRSLCGLGDRMLWWWESLMLFASVTGSNTALVCSCPPLTAALDKLVAISDMTNTRIGLVKAPQTTMALRCSFSVQTSKAMIAVNDWPPMQISPNLGLRTRKRADGHLQLQPLTYAGHEGTTCCVSIPLANPGSYSSEAGAHTERVVFPPHQAPSRYRTEAGWQGVRQQFAQPSFNLHLCCDWIYALRSTESNTQPFFKKCVILESI